MFRPPWSGGCPAYFWLDILQWLDPPGRRFAPLDSSGSEALGRVSADAPEWVVQFDYQLVCITLGERRHRQVPAAQVN